MKIDSSEFERSAKRALDRLAENVMEEVIKAGHEVRNEAIRKTPVDTGALRSGWKIRIQRLGKGGRVTVSNETPYARHVEYGTRYTRPQPMLGPAIRSVIPKLTARLRGLK